MPVRKAVKAADSSRPPATFFFSGLAHWYIASAAPTDFATALSIFQDAADTWREDGVPFWTLVGTTSGELDWLQDLA